ncbi:MAG: DciA family protein [Rickettsiales endosymbiont of Dermacentor nuttalli]
MRSLSNYLNKLTEPALKRYGIHYAKILTDWKEIVGIQLYNYTIPKKIIYSQNTNILHIEVLTSSGATDLYYMEPVIIEKLAIYLGSKIIKKIKIIQNPILQDDIKLLLRQEVCLSGQQERRLYNLLKIVEEPCLKSALHKLGSHIV